jgi:hypothetical protein
MEYILLECTDNSSAGGVWDYINMNIYHFPTIIPSSVPTVSPLNVYEWTQFTSGIPAKPTVLAYDGSEFITPVLHTSNLSDVSIFAPTLNQFLLYNGSYYTPSDFALSNLIDIDFVSL